MMKQNGRVQSINIGTVYNDNNNDTLINCLKCLQITDIISERLGFSYSLCNIMDGIVCENLDLSPHEKMLNYTIQGVLHGDPSVGKCTLPLTIPR